MRGASLTTWTPRFPPDLARDREGARAALPWRERIVTSLSNARTDDDGQLVLTGREGRVLRQFMRPPDGGQRRELLRSDEQYRVHVGGAGQQWRAAI